MGGSNRKILRSYPCDPRGWSFFPSQNIIGDAVLALSEESYSMVDFSIAGCVDSREYTICERLLDIMAASLPDITIEKEPCTVDVWNMRAFELARINGFPAPWKAESVRDVVLVWSNGRLISTSSEIFTLFVLSNYGIRIDLSAEQVDNYTLANIEAANKNIVHTY